MSGSPQNPYVSYVVAASAGSGKTYQLARRFLFLVGAGSPPGAVLTVTFTKKAAGEMRQRILEEAARLAANPAAQAAFDAELAGFHAAATGAAHAGGTPPPPPPRGAAAAAAQILAASQILKISTIDSLFLEWVSKFPCESGGEEGNAAPVSLLDPAGCRELDTRAWRATCQLLARALRGEGEDGRTAWLAEALALACPDGGVHELEERLRGLDRQETYLWYAEQLAQGEAAFLPHPPSDPLPLASDAVTEADLVGMLAGELRAICNLLASGERRDRCLAAIQNEDLEELFAAGLLARSRHAISGTVLGKKKRDLVAAEAERVEQRLRAFVDRRRLLALNRTGDAHYRLYLAYRALRTHLKRSAKALEFRDLVKGSFRLFHGDAGAGVRFLLARTINHVLLDEFQDTSRLQWAVFGEMATQLLAGQGVETAAGEAATVFIVGDAKQSIYGFREADPGVMDEVERSLADQLQVASLNASYRTAQVVLDFVNNVFAAGAIPDFPRHRTAALPDGRPFVPDTGRVLVANLVKAETDAEAEDASDTDGEPEGDDGDLAEREAEGLAGLLVSALAGEPPCPVFDKETKTYRPLRASDCCLLYRSTTKAAAFEAALRRAGIPCQREEERGFFARVEIADCLALLRWLALPSDLAALATVLRSPLAGVSDREMLAALAATKGTDDRARRTLQLLAASAAPLPATLLALAAQAERRLPHELLLEAMTRLDAFTAYARAEIAPGPEAVLAQRNLLRLVELCMTLEDDGITALPPLIERLEAMAADDELGNATAPKNAVTLMTIHKSKGLEYPLVALVDTGRPWGKRDPYWVQGKAAADGRPGLYYIGRRDDQPVADQTFLSLATAAADSTLSECQRLLYVALTRARQYLIITGHEPRRLGQGLRLTTPYAQLAAALAEPVAERTVTATTAEADAVWARAWSTVTLEAGAAAAAAARRTPTEAQAAASGPSQHTPLPPGSSPTGRSEPVAGTAAMESAAASRSLQDATAPRQRFLPPLAPPTAHLPRELYLKTPSRHETRRAGGPTSRLRPRPDPLRLAAPLGDFLHQGLQALMLGRPLARDAAATVWRQLTPGRPEAEAHFAAAYAELTALGGCAVLAQLRETAARLDCELPVVHRTGDELIFGKIDLLVRERSGRLLVVDYKSTAFDIDAADLRQVDDAELRRFCQDRGYDVQLTAYGGAVAAMQPGEAVATAVYFTALRRLVPL